MIKHFNKKLENLNFTVVNSKLFLRVFTLVIVGLYIGCDNSQLRIKVNGDLPLTFYFSGGGQFNKFIVKNGSDKTLWELYPKDGSVYFREISVITYGEVPSSCIQYVPKDLPPPILTEGEIYYASGSTSGSPTGNVTFTIKDGKVIELSHEP